MGGLDDVVLAGFSVLCDKEIIYRLLLGQRFKVPHIYLPALHQCAVSAQQGDLHVGNGGTREGIHHVAHKSSFTGRLRTGRN